MQRIQSRSAWDEGIVCPLGLQERSRRCEEHPQHPQQGDQAPDFGVRSGIRQSVTWEVPHHHGDQPLLLDSVQRLVPLRWPLWPYNTGAEGESRAGTITSSFTLRGVRLLSSNPGLTCQLGIKQWKIQKTAEEGAYVSPNTRHIGIRCPGTPAVNRDVVTEMATRLEGERTTEQTLSA